MRIVVLADIHGNLPALRAVLAEVDDLSADAIVVAGDVLGGPFPRESLELLGDRTEPVHWVRGNCERETVSAFDSEPVGDDAAGRAASWSARSLNRGWRDSIAGWPPALTLDGTVLCHGSPRRDDEILTRQTPDEGVMEAVQGAGAPLVVGGHTHQQFIRRLPGVTFANAGSVGMPYEGRPGAFWLVVSDGVPELRETAYDHVAAVSELRASGSPDVDDQFGESLLRPADPDWVAAFFEHAAGRREHLGPADPT